MLKDKIKYSSWLGSLTKPQLMAFASQAGIRDWLSMSRERLIKELSTHGKAQTNWAREHGVFDGEAEGSDTSGQDR